MTLRYPLTSEPLRSKLGPVLVGEQVSIFDVDPSDGSLGGLSTIFRNAIGAPTVAQPLVTNGDGIPSDPSTLIPCWLDPAVYAMTSPRLDYVVYVSAIGLDAAPVGVVTQAALDAVAAQLNVIPSLTVGGFTGGTYDVSNWAADKPAGKRFVNNSSTDRTIIVPQDSTAGHLTIDQFFVGHRRSGGVACGEMIFQGEIGGMFETPLSDTPVDGFKISVRNGTVTVVKVVTANRFIVDGYIALLP